MTLPKIQTLDKLFVLDRGEERYILNPNMHIVSWLTIQFVHHCWIIQEMQKGFSAFTFSSLKGGHAKCKLLESPETKIKTGWSTNKHTVVLDLRPKEKKTHIAN